MRFSRRALLAACLVAACDERPAAADTTARARFTGINLAGLEFGARHLPGRAGTDYGSPTIAELAYYAGCGANTARLPFLWERLQPRLGGPLDVAYLGLIDGLVHGARAAGLTLVLDAHQYGRRREGGQSRIIGEDLAVTSQHFADFWSALASHFAAQSHVVFGLLNEPHDQDLDNLVRVQNAAIAAIRATGARHLILVSGNGWSGAHSWISRGNGEAMLNIQDRIDNFAFDAHQYLDRDSSGTNAQCAPGSGAQRLAAFTQWARQHRKKGFLGEFGAAANDRCLTELGALLSFVDAHTDVWLGWTYWAGGPWWGDSYPLTIEPHDLDQPQDRPQMRVLRHHFARAA
jgi:endoglucanase